MRLYRPLLVLALLGGLAGVPAEAAPQPTGCGLGKIGKGSKPYRSAGMVKAPHALYGDSISVQGNPLLRSRDRSLAVDALGGRKTAPTVDVLARDLAAGSVPEVVVMAIGTNDRAAPEQVGDQVRRVRSLLPLTTRILWVNTYTEGNERWREVNLQIAAMPSIEIVDWAGVNLLARGQAAKSPYLFDGVHLSCAGARAWVALIAGAIGSPPRPAHLTLPSGQGQVPGTSDHAGVVSAR